MFVPSVSSRTICTLVVVAVLLLITATTYHLGLADDLLESAPWTRPDDFRPPPPPPPPPQYLDGDHSGSQHNSGSNLNNFQGPVSTLPLGTKVIGLVFYGRRELVRVLDCYLKRNLKANGGILDEVIFAINTDNEGDLAYLEELINTDASYSKHVPQGEYDSHWWFGNWEAVSDRDAIYVKIDDDVVFIEDNTIVTIVNRLWDNPQYFAVSANVVNNPALSWVHNRLGVYEPYWPEMQRPNNTPPRSWRASELPSYEGPPTGPEGFDYKGSTPAPYEGHRWLPVRLQPGETYDMSLTPASTLTYDAHGPSLHNWAAGAQTHYSFLQHLEQGDTSKYKFDTWDYLYERLSINFIAFRGSDILDVFPFPQPDDEDYLTTVRSKELGKHVIVDGTGLAVHFAFGPQRKAHEGKGLGWTDALSRYAAYAEERVCPFPNSAAATVP